MLARRFSSVSSIELRRSVGLRHGVSLWKLEKRVGSCRLTSCPKCSRPPCSIQTRAKDMYGWEGVHSKQGALRLGVGPLISYGLQAADQVEGGRCTGRRCSGWVAQGGELFWAQGKVKATRLAESSRAAAKSRDSPAAIAHGILSKPASAMHELETYGRCSSVVHRIGAVASPHSPPRSKTTASWLRVRFSFTPPTTACPARPS